MSLPRSTLKTVRHFIDRALFAAQVALFLYAAAWFIKWLAT